VPAADRLSLAPLSAPAVAALAGDDAGWLHARTGGNPFFVTELLAAPDGSAIPPTVTDAVLARTARMSPGARRLLEAVAVVPQRTEVWLLEALAGQDAGELEGCLASGVLRADGATVAFRHEIARVAVEESLPPHRRVDLHGRALRALAGRADPARLAHHAESAGDAAAVVEHATAAGERAATLGAHREAAAQFARGLRHAHVLEPAARAALLERHAYECYLTDQVGAAVVAQEQARDAHRAGGDRLREGDSERWLSRLAWFHGDNRRAEEAAARAVALLEPLPEGRELAMAWSNVAQLRMLAWDRPGAVEWGTRAIALAERLGETEILVHALNNVGSSEWRDGDRSGPDKLERSLALALEAGLEEHVARAYTNLSSIAVELHEHAAADDWLRAGIEYCRHRDLGSWELYMTGWRARSELDQGRWQAAMASAMWVLGQPSVAVPSRITALAVLGALRARRGDPDPWTPLDEARELARRTGEAQRIVPVAVARAEACWLAGEPDRIAAETAEAMPLALARGGPWLAGALWVWRRRAGADVPRGAQAAGPMRAELDGDARGAAERWTRLGEPYEAALALAWSPHEEDLRASLDAVQGLGAAASARWVARRLRERGARSVPRGPRGATRGNPHGLTARQVEVLALLARGERNADIAARLFLSERTVDHHVSAILRKLGVPTRAAAGAEAVRLGLTIPP
jgi:DNA-binding CsgD family transcriptional regulator